MVSDFGETDVQSDQVFVVMQQSVPPVVLIVASLERSHNQQLHVEVPDNEATSAAAEGLIMRGDLLRADSVHQDSHVVCVAEHQRIVSSVVRVLVTFVELMDFAMVIARAIFLLVLWSVPTNLSQILKFIVRHLALTQRKRSS